MPRVSISVVIPTYRRPEALTRCLDALARQDKVADEILVVVRREDAASRDCIGARGVNSIRLIPIDVAGGRPGVVAALNAGVAASSGAIVCLTDDDAEPRPDWIARICASFGADASIGAVGGRDWVYHGDHLEQGEESVVGTVSWWGRTIGRHHLGVGSARDVEVLKGVNLSGRGDLLRSVGFDTRLLGIATEHHWELGLCLRLRRMGYRIVYDPAIAVDHRPQPRVVETRDFGPRQVRDSAHNETLALLEHLSPMGQVAHLFWSTMLGSRGTPGLAQSVRLLITTGDPRLTLLRANLQGRRLAVATYRRGRRRASSS
jgi:GT2 family glycosyltransferase